MDVAGEKTGAERAARAILGLLGALGGGAGGFFCYMVWFWRGYGGLPVPVWVYPAFGAALVLLAAGLRAAPPGAERGRLRGPSRRGQPRAMRIRIPGPVLVRGLRAAPGCVGCGAPATTTCTALMSQISPGLQLALLLGASLAVEQTHRRQFASCANCAWRSTWWPAAWLVAFGLLFVVGIAMMGHGADPDGTGEASRRLAKYLSLLWSPARR